MRSREWCRSRTEHNSDIVVVSFYISSTEFKRSPYFYLLIHLFNFLFSARLNREFEFDNEEREEEDLDSLMAKIG